MTFSVSRSMASSANAVPKRLWRSSPQATSP